MTGSPPTGDGGPHVFVSSLDALDVADDDAHHLRRVLRLRDGDPLTASDGAGRWRAARFGSPLEPAGEIVTVQPPVPEIAVGFVVPKGDRPAWIVQKLTELGVDRILLLSSQRSVVRWEGERGKKHLERLRTVARSAAMQSRQVRLPVLEPLQSVRQALGAGAVALAHPGGDPPSLTTPRVLIGPEGGWSAEELADAPATMALSGSVLRAETAAVVAGSTLALLRSQLVLEHRA